MTSMRLANNVAHVFIYYINIVLANSTRNKWSNSWVRTKYYVYSDLRIIHYKPRHLLNNPCLVGTSSAVWVILLFRHLEIDFSKKFFDADDKLKTKFWNNIELRQPFYLELKIRSFVFYFYFLVIRFEWHNWIISTNNIYCFSHSLDLGFFFQSNKHQIVWMYLMNLYDFEFWYEYCVTFLYHEMHRFSNIFF